MSQVKQRKKKNTTRQTTRLTQRHMKCNTNTKSNKRNKYTQSCLLSGRRMSIHNHSSERRRPMLGHCRGIRLFHWSFVQIPWATCLAIVVSKKGCWRVGITVKHGCFVRCFVGKSGENGGVVRRVVSIMWSSGRVVCKIGENDYVVHRFLPSELPTWVYHEPLHTPGRPSKCQQPPPPKPH